MAWDGCAGGTQWLKQVSAAAGNFWLMPVYNYSLKGVTLG